MKYQFTKSIFIVSPFESSLSKRGTRHPVLAKIFIEKKYNVRYVTSNFYHASRNHFLEEYIKKISNKLPYNLKVLKVLGYKKNISISRVITHFQFGLKSFFYLNKIIQSGDIVILPSRPPELIWGASLLKRENNVKLILDIRDIWPDAFPIKRGLIRKLFVIYCNIFLKKSLLKFDKFICTSPNYKNWLNRFAPQKNPAFIPLGFNKTLWEDLRPKSLGDFKNKFNIFYIGNLTSNINIFNVIEAIKNNNKFKFTVIGGGEELPKIQEYIQNNSINNIQLTGIIKPNEVPEYLSYQHLSIIPMRLDCMPNKLFDSIAAYIPILVIGENDTSKFVRQNDIGWALPFNINKIKDFFNKLNKQDIMKKSRNIAKIREQFSKENLYEKYVEYVFG